MSTTVLVSISALSRWSVAGGVLPSPRDAALTCTRQLSRACLCTRWLGIARPCTVIMRLDVLVRHGGLLASWLYGVDLLTLCCSDTVWWTIPATVAACW